MTESDLKSHSLWHLHKARFIKLEKKAELRRKLRPTTPKWWWSHQQSLDCYSQAMPNKHEEQLVSEKGW